MRIRKTEHWGNSNVIVISSSDVKDFNINIGKDEVDIEDLIII